MIAAFVLAGVLDPNCIPRHHAHQPRARAMEVAASAPYHYHSHYYHPPLQPACREPWPDLHLHEARAPDFPHSPVPAEPVDLGHSPLVVWPGYVPNPPVRKPNGAPVSRPEVGVPEPPMPLLLLLGIGALAGTRLCRRQPAPGR
jgi:hypothetical protein